MQNRFYIEIGLNDYIQINAKENISNNGNLVNVSEIAVDLGFAYPVYIAECAWNSCLAYLKKDEEMNLNSLLNYMLIMLKVAITNKVDSIDTSLVSFHLSIRLEDKQEPWVLNLTALIGVNSAGKPMIIIKQAKN